MHASRLYAHRQARKYLAVHPKKTGRLQVRFLPAPPQTTRGSSFWRFERPTRTLEPAQCLPMAGRWSPKPLGQVRFLGDVRWRFDSACMSTGPGSIPGMARGAWAQSSGRREQCTHTCPPLRRFAIRGWPGSRVQDIRVDTRAWTRRYCLPPTSGR